MAARKSPGPAAAARAQLATDYDREAASTEDMANLAKQSGALNAAQNLTNIAQRKRTYAQRARKPKVTTPQ